MEEKKEELKEVKKDEPIKGLKEKKESVISIAWVVAGLLALIMIVLGVLLAVKGSISLGGYTLSMGKYQTMGKQAAIDKVTKYINDDLLQNQVEATVSNVKDDKGVYSMTVTFSGQDVNSYMSKDGTLFFPEAYEMDETASTNTNTNASSTNQSTEAPKAEKATALLFTMSYCPYGNLAESAMKPVVDLLKDKAIIEPHYVIYNSDFGYEGSEYCLDSENKYCSMHGIQELNQDVRELCAFKYQPDKYWAFVEKANANCTSKDVDTCWEEQAKSAGLDTAKISTCQKDEALTLLANEVALNEKYAVTGSPSLVINDTAISASRTSEAYKTAVCSGFNTAPEECSTKLSESSDTGTGSDASCGS
ncbi:MAG: hypothetical protein WC752_01310 [Patescibacteria group bacterium]|jgi:hypothetical protein